MINLFSIFDLAGLTIAAELAAVFYLRYRYLGRRRLELLFANAAACSAGVCLAMFLADNVVPAGAQATAAPRGAATTLNCARWIYALNMLFAASMAHLATRYCHGDSRRLRRIPVIYALCVGVAILAWTPWFFRPSEAPVAAEAGWTVTSPWWPTPGPLLLVFFSLGAVLFVYTQRILWKPAQCDPSGGSVATTGAIRWAVLIYAAGGLADTLTSYATWSGVGLFPISAVLSGAIVARALMRESAQRERAELHIEHEFELAARIQNGLLEQCPSQEIPWFDVSAWNRPASRVGGDTYDVMPLPNGRWLLALGDASGHGLAPSLTIAETRACLRALAMQETDPSMILARARALISRALAPGRFVTCFVGLLEPQTGALAYASAGQGPILFYEAKTGQCYREIATEPPLMPLPADPSPETRIRILRPGDLLVVPSDGLWEAPRAGGEPFGIERLVDVLSRCAALPAGQISQAALAELARFRGSREQVDDVTVLILKRAVSTPVGPGGERLADAGAAAAG